MNIKEITDGLRDMFDDVNDPLTLKEMQEAFLEGGEQVVTQEDLFEGCTALMLEGMVEQVGVDKYRTTDAYMEAQEAAFLEGASGLIAEHVIKKAAGK